METTTRLALRNPDKLSAQITAAGLKPKHLATQTGLSVSRIYQLTQGHLPSLSAPAAIALAAALDIDVRELFTFPDGPELVQLGLIDA